ncbi:DegV family protein [Murimonas intestini]|uniref:DegV family protein with EDD domain n=1 Tax=Murimonas intestini TaxID=1337051 RepID=A0AB73T0P4_9FIRM|nr:DegV family protein [Murimonas intestini]MCR1842332.1 DegV family protein [Murimonas intestini]MCR1867745.1 DegV family protein [Murimonas intestini]MCR1885943.1 DegV family protein [Murimonas intestini]
MEYQIISDGSCDLGVRTAKENYIEIVPFYVSFDGENYKKEIEEIGVREFYQKMVDNPTLYPKSSLPNVEDYLRVFRPYAAEGIPVICICITSKFSGSYTSAVNAGQIISEEFPGARIEVIDSSVNTVLQGLVVLEAAKMRDAGFTFEENVRRLEEIKSTGRIFFTIGGMEYLVHGGRVGKLMGAAGATLGIRPLITLKEGEIFPSGISRSRKKSMQKVIELVRKHFHETGEDPNSYSFVTGYGYDYEEAVGFRDELLRSLSEYSNVRQMDIYQIGATIGVHTGPYPIGTGLVKKAV